MSTLAEHIELLNGFIEVIQMLKQLQKRSTTARLALKQIDYSALN